MRAVSGRELCKVLEDHGWIHVRTTGSHHMYGRPGNPTVLSVPVHGNQDLGIGLLRRLMRQAGLTEADL